MHSHPVRCHHAYICTLHLACKALCIHKHLVRCHQSYIHICHSRMCLVHLTFIPPLIEPPCTMLRLDAASLSTPSNHTPSSSPSQSTPPDHTPDPALLYMVSLKLHRLLLDDLQLHETTVPFLCSSISNLSQGVGVAISDTVSLIYDHQIKVGVAK